MLFRIDAGDLKKLSRALKSEENGKELRKDLLREFRAAAKPVRDEMRANILAMPSKGVAHPGPSLRAGIARRVGIRTRLNGRTVAVWIKANETPNLRGFAAAPHHTNAAKGWRHPFMGDREQWYAQVGAPGWFDKPKLRNRLKFHRAAKKAMNSTADRIARKV